MPLRSLGLDFQRKAEVLAIAKGLVAEGVQMIELCGGFGPVWMAKVSEAMAVQFQWAECFMGPTRRPMLDLTMSDSGVFR